MTEFIQAQDITLGGIYLGLFVFNCIVFLRVCRYDFRITSVFFMPLAAMHLLSHADWYWYAEEVISASVIIGFRQSALSMGAVDCLLLVTTGLANSFSRIEHARIYYMIFVLLFIPRAVLNGLYLALTGDDSEVFTNTMRLSGLNMIYIIQCIMFYLAIGPYRALYRQDKNWKSGPRTAPHAVANIHTKQ